MTRVANFAPAILDCFAKVGLGLAFVCFVAMPLGHIVVAIAVPAPSLVVLRTEPVPVSAIRRPSTIAARL